MLDVVALGELLIDFTPAGCSEAGNALLERNPGGAPANVLAAIAKLGGQGAFIGKVGDDQFGRYLRDVLQENRVSTQGLKLSGSVNTTLAFVHLDESGDRSFSFYRKPGADIMLTEQEVDLNLIESAKIFHFGSLSMTDEPARSATLKAVKHAKQNGVVVSYDPNWRPPLWENAEIAKEQMRAGLEYADILKISEVELELLTGETDLKKGAEILFKKDLKLLLITLGPDGCFYRGVNGTGRLPTYDTRVVDTTGAGDAFLGALLYSVCRAGHGLGALTVAETEEMIDFSNAAGALCASKRGAIPAVPSCEEVRHCMAHMPKLQRSISL